jgi:hypothetical protein
MELQQHVQNTTKFRQLIPLADGNVIEVGPDAVVPVPKSDWDTYKEDAKGRTALVEVGDPETADVREAVQGGPDVDLVAARARAKGK